MSPPPALHRRITGGIESLSAADAVSSVSPTPPFILSPPFAERYQLSAGYVRSVHRCSFASVFTAVSDAEIGLETSLIANGTSGQAALPRVMSAPVIAAMLNTLRSPGRHLQCLTARFFSIGRTTPPSSKQARLPTIPLTHRIRHHRGSNKPKHDRQQDKHQVITPRARQRSGNGEATPLQPYAPHVPFYEYAYWRPVFNACTAVLPPRSIRHLAFNRHILPISSRNYRHQTPAPNTVAI